MLATLFIFIFANGLSLVSFPIGDFDSLSQSQLLDMIFGNDTDLFLGKLGIGLLIGIPALSPDTNSKIFTFILYL